MASALAATAMLACDRRFIADWAQDNERRAAAQRAETAQVTAHYDGQAQRREGAENLENRRRAAALRRGSG
jgi:hypothetical protein